MSSMPRPFVPSVPVPVQGEIVRSVGRYARHAVMFAFEQIGGADELANWAKDNRGDFYTKLFTKVITREVDVSDSRSVDELMDALDGEYEVVQDGGASCPEQPGPPPVPGGGSFSSSDSFEVSADEYDHE